MRNVLLTLLAVIMIACGAANKSGETGTNAGTTAGTTAADGGTVATTSDAGATADAGSSTGTIECTLGSVYGDAPTIDPDNPVYSDSEWTQADIEAAFAQAQADNTTAYQAYHFAASADGSILECAFCACGCATTQGHLSAIDCFKDMHGFS
ncbi:MAG: hypothetical protein GXP62_04390 [Oligoflexia bacterium]|nr:hypothetical protein [Oligoflexia bacterium]